MYLCVNLLVPLCIVYVFVLYQTRVLAKAMASGSSLQHSKLDALFYKQSVKKSLSFRVLPTLKFSITRQKLAKVFNTKQKV